MSDAAETKQGKAWIKPALFGIVLIGLFVAARLVDIESGLGAARAWIESLGAWGPVAFIGLYVLATVLMVPGSVPTILAGGLFGAVWGTVYVSIASVLGAALAFLIARYVLRDHVAGWLSKKPGLAKIDRLTASHGTLIVAIIRLVPLFPFNIVNYAFGLTRIGFGRYVIVSWICMLPGTFLYVAGTDAVLEAISSGEIPWLLIGAVLAVFVLLFFVGRKAAGRLKAAEAATGDAPLEEGS